VLICGYLSQPSWHALCGPSIEVNMTGFVYILANKPNGTLYTGVTSDLIKRVYQHKEDITKGFTHKYNIRMLVYYEVFDRIEDAIMRETRIKKYPRRWKINLISGINPTWQDLYWDAAGMDGPNKSGHDE
jgi:putative endonuclease